MYLLHFGNSSIGQWELALCHLLSIVNVSVDTWTGTQAVSEKGKAPAPKAIVPPTGAKGVHAPTSAVRLKNWTKEGGMNKSWCSRDCEAAPGPLSLES